MDIIGRAIEDGSVSIGGAASREADAPAAGAAGGRYRLTITRFSGHLSAATVLEDLRFKTLRGAVAIARARINENQGRVRREAKTGYLAAVKDSHLPAGDRTVFATGVGYGEWPARLRREVIRLQDGRYRKQPARPPGAPIIAE
jgi:hypothetical protein